MKDFTLGILGNNFKETTEFINKIILNTKASCDQEHMKINIIINNKLLNDKDEIKKILEKLEMIKSDFLCLTFDNKEIYDFIKENTNIPVLNDSFNVNDNSLIENILNRFYEA